MSSDFLPEGYTPPKDTGGKYINPSKIDGSIRLRILASPLVGYEAWKEKNPVRGKTVEEVNEKGYDPVDSWGNPQTVKHFWALKVYDYEAGVVKILSITQKTLRNRLTELSESEDWGNPTKYDIQINKTGEKMETEYSITPIPPKPFPADAQKIVDSTPMNLEALYEGGDPFAEEMPL